MTFNIQVNGHIVLGFYWKLPGGLWKICAVGNLFRVFIKASLQLVANYCSFLWNSLKKDHPDFSLLLFIALQSVAL